MNAQPPRAPYLPDSRARSLAEAASRRLSAHLADADVLTLSLDGEDVSLPADVLRLFVEMLTELSEGRAVSIIPTEAELTTQQAADLLNVSRPFLVDLLEKGAIPHHKVGTHRRIRFQDLQTYRTRRDREQKQALDDLAALGETFEDGET